MIGMARKYGFLILSGCFLISFMIPDEVYTQEKSYFGHEEFPQDIYAARRQRFMDQMDDGLAVIPGKVRNTYGQVDERPARYFYYLTGIEEPGAWCILDPSSSETYKLFVRPYRLMLKSQKLFMGLTRPFHQTTWTG